ncbi:Omega-amidase NIT2 [Capsicum baccatum]|uniref:Omega-amidase NIT2 n=1 Tax=Capsicum baccatum TaxID=33114 RepID=A0A2G2XRY0_CAPBA|nr:Omega-amidase NIT2 [Capsicum baccatum]
MRVGSLFFVSSSLSSSSSSLSVIGSSICRSIIRPAPSLLHRLPFHFIPNRTTLTCSMASSFKPEQARVPPSLQLPSPPITKFNIGLCQLAVTSDKERNIVHARAAIEEAAEKGAKLVVLPEIWNSPYSNDSFPIYAEDIDAGPDASPSTAMLSEVAQLLKITIVGGSIPERSGDKLYNTCCVFDADGKLKAKHRKIHLFDIDIPGKITFKESQTLTAGETPTVVDTEVGRIGIGICYDIRFQELAMLYAARGFIAVQGQNKSIIIDHKQRRLGKQCTQNTQVHTGTRKFTGNHDSPNRAVELILQRGVNSNRWTTEASRKAQIQIPDESIKIVGGASASSKDLLGRCIVGKFQNSSEEPPTLNNVRRWACNTWKTTFVITFAMTDGHFFFEMPSKEVAEHVLSDKCIWKKMTLILQWWKPTTGCWPTEIRSDWLWIKLLGLPLSMCLEELPNTGCKYTWNDKQDARILSKIDWVFVNGEWVVVYWHESSYVTGGGQRSLSSSGVIVAV